MTDREMLELAAKAAGIPIDRSETNGGGVGNDGFGLTGDLMLDWHNDIRWNPLRDDGDALRLAVKLRIDVDHGEMNDAQGTPIVIAHYRYTLKSGQVCWNTRSEQYGDDQCAATRRAIVRAAAEIGRAMP